MKITSLKPFQDFDCYTVFHKKMKRWQVCLVNKKNKKIRRTILYSKFLMSIEVGRILEREEEVDHVDGDKLNDDLRNLEIVTREENERRERLRNPIQIIRIECPCCGSIFEKLFYRSSMYLKNVKNNYCSRKCQGKMTGRKKGTKNTSVAQKVVAISS